MSSDGKHILFLSSTDPGRIDNTRWLQVVFNQVESCHLCIDAFGELLLPSFARLWGNTPKFMGLTIDNEYRGH